MNTTSVAKTTVPFKTNTLTPKASNEVTTTLTKKNFEKIIYYDCLETNNYTNNNNNNNNNDNKNDLNSNSNSNNNNTIKININNNIINNINIDQYKLSNWDDIDNYELITKIGNGKYGTVFLGYNIKLNNSNENKCAIKIIRPILKYHKLIKEAEFLDQLKACPNIIKLLTCIYDESSKNLSLVFEYINNIKYCDLIPLISDSDIRYYAHQLLLSLNYLYNKKIMHRDIKPQNVMFDHNKRIIKLIDFGLAEYYTEGKQYSIHVASRYYKAPELLSNYCYYSCAIDMWSYGLMIASLILKTEPIFRGSDVFNQLSLIIQALGIQDYKTFLIKYKLKWSSQIKLHCNTKNIVERRKLTEFCKITSNSLRQINITTNIEDLLNSILRLDPEERLTPPQALQHKYFQEVKADCNLKKLQKDKMSATIRNSTLFSPQPTIYQQNNKTNLVANKKIMLAKSLKTITAGGSLVFNPQCSETKSNFLKTIKRRTHSDIKNNSKDTTYAEENTFHDCKVQNLSTKKAISILPRATNEEGDLLRAKTEPNLLNFRLSSICFR